MGTRETVTQSSRFYCVSLTPDLCKTPVGSATPPLPYTIMGEFSQATSVSPNVKSQGAKVLLHGKSTVPSTTGDNPGSAGGVKSGTTGSKVETKDFSSTVRSNVKSLVREGDMVWMNAKNTIGKVYERGVQGAKDRIKDLGDTANKKLGEAKEAAKPYAQHYKDNVSETLHEVGQKAMDVGGKIGVASGGVAVAGLAVGATGVGLPAAAVMEGTAAAGGAVGGVVTGVGAATETTATLGDKFADYVLTGKSPDVLGTAAGIAQNLAENVVLKKLSGLKNLFGGKGGKPGKPPEKAPPPPPPPSNSKDGAKNQPKKEEHGDKPPVCCLPQKAPAGKSARSRRPVHFGTGEEILEQTDFVTEGTSPLAWTRIYRSGSETEDWGLLGARWATQFTTAVSAHRHGVIVHDATGRALRLPPLAPGQSHRHDIEGFTLHCDSHTRFTLTWTDGATDIFEIGEGSQRHGVLPHGHDGANAMLAPGAPLRVLRYPLRRSQARSGEGFSVQHIPDALPRAVLLRVVADDGTTLEALRGDATAESEAPRIVQVDEVLADGTRITHVRYQYDSELRPDTTLPAFSLTAAEALPVRHNLVAQSNVLGHTRHYRYRLHLLVGYTTYGGFAHGLEWVSLAALRARWRGSELDDEALALQHPIRLDDSYRARAVRTFTQDGTEEHRIAYVADGTTRVTEPDGGQLQFEFNALWRVTALKRIGADGKATNLGRQEWSAHGHLLGEVDAAGHVTRYGYDAQGNVTRLVDANGRVTRVEHDAGNRPVAVIDPLGHVTRHAYDTLGRLEVVTDPLGHTTRFQRDAHGRLATITDAKGGDKTVRYDAAGRVAEFVDCSGHSTRYQYDARGRLVAVKSSAGTTTHYEHDALGRVIRISHPAAADGTPLQEHFSHDADGNLVAHTDTGGNVTRYRYNGQGQPLLRVDAKGQTLQYRYDAALRLVELVNGNGDVYTFAYDAHGRVVRTTDFTGKVTSTAFDEAGRVTSTDVAGRHVDYVHDPLGQLLARSDGDGVVRYAYDAAGRLTAVSAPNAQQRYVYDAASQLLEERSAYTLGRPELNEDTFVAPPPVAEFVMRHAYDELGNRIQTILPNGRRVDTLRYGSGHWHGTLWHGQAIVDVERDALHRETARQLGVVARGAPRLQEQRAYDPQSRLSTLRLGMGGQTLQARHHAYDAAGNVARIEDLRRGTTQYTYDPLGQLLSSLQPQVAETFAFDPAGNIVDPQASVPKADASVPAMSAVTHDLLRHHLGTTYAYDLHGNTVLQRPPKGTGGGTELRLHYDEQNRLVVAATCAWGSDSDTPPLQAFRYLYDAWGRRIAKQAIHNGGVQGDTTLFVWEGDQLAQEVRPDETITYLYEPDSFVPMARVESAGGFGTGCDTPVHLWHEAVWDLPGDASASDAQVEAWRQEKARLLEQSHGLHVAQRDMQAQAGAAGDRIAYYHCDHLGTPQALHDAGGRLLWSASRKAWGGLDRTDVAEVAQPLQFQGQYRDSETGFHYNRYRFYDANTGRFLTQDPLGLAGGVNPYQFAPNPTGWLDPLGLKKHCGLVYRSLAAHQEPEAKAGLPLTPKNPAAKFSAQQHVEDGKRRTQFVSTSMNPMRAAFYGRKHNATMVVIDLCKIPDEQIVDVSKGQGLVDNPGKGQFARKWATRDQEVLIRGSVPSSAYAVFTPGGSRGP